MKNDWNDWVYVVAAAPGMKKALEEINELTLQDGDPEELLKKISVEAVKSLRECKGKQG